LFEDAASCFFMHILDVGCDVMLPPTVDVDAVSVSTFKCNFGLCPSPLSSQPRLAHWLAWIGAGGCSLGGTISSPRSASTAVCFWSCVFGVRSRRGVWCLRCPPARFPAILLPLHVSKPEARRAKAKRSPSSREVRPEGQVLHATPRSFGIVATSSAPFSRVRGTCRTAMLFRP